MSVSLCGNAFETTNYPQADAFKCHLLSESQTQWTYN